MATKITIGATQYQVDEMSFSALERAWPHIEYATTASDPITSVSAAIHVIAAALLESEGLNLQAFEIEVDTTSATAAARDDLYFYRMVDFLKKKLKASQIEQVREGLVLILREAGLEEKTEDEDKDAGEATLPGILPDI